MKRAVRRESLCTVKIGGSCTLYLAEIPSHENTPFHLCNYFCKFGTLLNVVCGYNGDPSAAAVTFEKHESAKAAMKSSNQLLKNRSIKMTLVPSNVGATTSKSKCVLCNKELATKRGLSAHVKRVHSGTTFECEHCKAPFASVNMYKKHLENQHANAIETVVNKKSPDVSDQTKLKEQIKQIASLNAKVESLEIENETSAKKLKLAEKTGKVIENQLKEKNKQLEGKDVELATMREKISSLQAENTEIMGTLKNERLKVANSLKRAMDTFRNNFDDWELAAQ